MWSNRDNFLSCDGTWKLLVPPSLLFGQSSCSYSRGSALFRTVRPWSVLGPRFTLQSRIGTHDRGGQTPSRRSSWCPYISLVKRPEQYTIPTGMFSCEHRRTKSTERFLHLLPSVSTAPAQAQFDTEESWSNCIDESRGFAEGEHRDSYGHVGHDGDALYEQRRDGGNDGATKLDEGSKNSLFQENTRI